MLELMEITDLEIRVRELGYKNPVHYARSKLYAIVKERILERDGGKCRVIGCSNPATKLQYVELSLKTLAGYPHLIFSFCSDCSARVPIVSPPISERLTLNNVFRLVSGIRKRQGYADGNIGVWYHDQFNSTANFATAELIKADLLTLSPEDWERVGRVWNTKEDE